MKKLLSLALLAVSAASFAGTYYYNGSLTANSPTFHHPNASATGTGVQFYSVTQFTVDTSGNYTIETASPNTSTSGVSNALDTFLALYAGSFNPASPGAGTFNDDFTGTFTVLPGPYAGTVAPNATGFTGAQPGSRLLNVALTTGTQYFLVNTSFRATDFVSTGTSGQATGNFYTGISGPGNISVPEPASMAILGLGALAMLRKRRKA